MRYFTSQGSSNTKIKEEVTALKAHIVSMEKEQAYVVNAAVKVKRAKFRRFRRLKWGSVLRMACGVACLPLLLYIPNMWGHVSSRTAVQSERSYCSTGALLVK